MNSSSISKNETFIRLVQLIRDDLELTKWFKQFSTMDAIRQNSLLTGVVEAMKVKGEKLELIQAFELLRHIEVIAQVKLILAESV